MDEPQDLHAICERLLSDNESPSQDRFIGWETIVTIIAWKGLEACLPFLRELLLPSAIKFELRKQELIQQLEDYAKSKELDFPKAKKAAETLVKHISAKNLKKIIKQVESASEEDVS